MPLLGTQGGLIFWISTMVVDIDHYVEFIFLTRFRKLGFKPMFRFFEELFQRRDRKEFLVLEIFHTFEFLGLLALLAWGWGGPVLYVFYGVLFHMVVDFFHLLRYGALGKRSPSLIEYHLRKRKFFSEGKNPHRVIEEALQEAGID